jgi:parallel beta-helix repeat protein
MPIRLDLAAVGRLILLTAAVVGAFAFTVDPAFATHVRCGNTVVEDTTLDSDLVNCPNNGIVIAADDVTLDLNGHRIDGDGEPTEGCAEDVLCDVGVVNEGHARVTIRHGSVREFGLGVLVGGARRTRLLDLSVARNMFSGVVIADSARTELSRSVVATNGLDTDQAGIGVFQSGHSRIERNSIRRNGDIGVFAEGANDTIFARNKLSGHPEAAMLLEESNRNVFDRNRVLRNREGITVAGNRNRITRNRVADSRADAEGGGLGIFVAAGHNNVVARNFVARANRSGIQVSLLPEELEGGTPAVDTVVRRNHLRDNRDGVRVQTTARRTVLTGNRARHSGDDGIDVDSPSTTLIGNHAIRNADLGIEAVRGITDGGRNIASGNGNPLQCANVFCR